MIKRATFYRMPPEAERQEWCRWLKHHTIDPNDVMVSGIGRPGFIEIDTCLRRVLHLGYDGGDGREVEVQLESVPSDFPALYSFFTDVKVRSDPTEILQ